MHIDWWTLALQTGNFLILVWLLQRFLYKPVVAVIARRQSEIAALMQDAAAAKTGAEKLTRELHDKTAAIAAERDRVLQEAQADGERERAARLQEAQREAAALIEAARRHLDRERAEAVGDLRDKASALGVEIARQLLAAAAADGTVAPFLERVCASIGRLPAAERQRLAAELTGGHRLRVVTATPLAAPEAVRCAARLRELLRPDLEIEFADDVALIAGIELHFPHTILRDTWRDALAQAREKLHEDESAQRRA